MLGFIGKRSFPRAGFIVGLASLLHAAGCSDSVLDPIAPSAGTPDIPFEQSSGDPTLLTSVALDDGSEIEFIEVDGAIVLRATSVDSDQSLLADAFHIDEIVEPVAIYERLANAPAPAELVAAQERVLATSEWNEPDGPRPLDYELAPYGQGKVDSGDRPDGTVWAPGVQSASTFQTLYCDREFTNLDWTLRTCWTDLNAASWTPYVYSYGQLGVAHCQNGNQLQHGLLKWNFSSASWELVFPVDRISTGQSSWYYHFGSGYYRSIVTYVGSWERFHMTFKTL